MKTALIVIDVQNAFINEQTQAIPDLIAQHLEEATYDFVIFTKFVNKQGSNFERILDWHKCFGSPDTDLDEALEPYAKHVFERSAYSIFKSKELKFFLAESEIGRLFLCGLDTDACVLASAFEAFDLGYDFEVINELTYNMKDDRFHYDGLEIIKKNLSRPS